MRKIYGEDQRALQEEFDTVRLADRIEQAIIRPFVPDDAKAFIESRDMLFLATVDHRGYPTCSYKGGAQGFVRVVDPKTIVFPSYNGNGMFLSMGNIGGERKMLLFFLYFSSP